MLAMAILRTPSPASWLLQESNSLQLFDNQPRQPLLEHPVLRPQLLNLIQQIQRQGDAFPLQLQVVPQFRGTLGQRQLIIGETPILGLLALRFEDAVLDDFCLLYTSDAADE